MNRSSLATVETAVRFLATSCLFLFFPLLLGACSSSRLVKQDQVFENTTQSIGSVIGSDILVGPGASLNVDYASQSRFFVSSGSSLAGFSKGISRSEIYLERGATIPTIRPNQSNRVVEVENAAVLYQDRLLKLLPPGATGQSRSPAPGRVLVGGSIGWGYYHSPFYYPNSHYSHHSYRPPSGSVSVQPKSYRRVDLTLP